MTTTTNLRDAGGRLDIDAATAEQRRLLDTGQAIIADADREHRELNDRDRSRLADINARVENLFAEIRVEEEGRVLLPRKVSPDPVPGGVSHDGPAPARAGVASTSRRLFAQMFGPTVANESGGWKSEAEYLRAIYIGDRSRLRPLAAVATEGIGQDGGFAVPVGYLGKLLDSSLESEIVRPRATIIPMPFGNGITGRPDLSSHAGGAHAGLLPVWLAENETATPQKAKWESVSLKSKKMAIFTAVSSELEADAPNFGATLAELMGDSVALGLDQAFLHGTGAGQPLGVFNSTALITVAAEGGQTADTITYLNVVKMLARLHPASWSRAIWLVSPTAIPDLMRLNFGARSDAGAAIADTGVAAPVFTQLADGTFNMLGRPVVVSEKAKPIGDVGDILLADFSTYAIGVSPRAGLERDNSTGWLSDTVHFRLIVRMDGMPKWGSTYTPLNGSTLSPFVTLAAR